MASSRTSEPVIAHIRTVHRLPIILPLALALLLLSTGGTLLGSFIANLSGVGLIKMEPCNPDWFACRDGTFPYPPVAYAGNKKTLARLEQHLDTAMQFDSGARSVRVRAAEASFALGNREKAAKMLAPWLGDCRVQWPSLSYTKEEMLNGVPTLLLSPHHYEYYLIMGAYCAEREEWDEAVEAYRYGLALGAERTLPVDEQRFFLALAALQREQMTKYPDDVRAVYLTGKYLAQAGEWEEAISWLQRALEPRRMGDLRLKARGWAYTYLGLALENTGDLEAARKAYERAIDTAPDLTEGYARLLALLRRVGEVESAEEAEQHLAALEPSYVLGRQGAGYKVEEPKAFANGRTLLGYGVDEQMLEAGPPVDLLLWWKVSEAAQPTGENWLQVGDRWLQWQHVVNLAPNAGFEWNTEDEELPAGYVREYYQAVPGSIFVGSRERGDQITNVLIADNAISRRVGVVGPRVAVDGSGLYLMTGWKWDAGNGNIGRLCYGENFGSVYYIAYPGEEPKRSWVHFAEVSPVLPKKKPSNCASFLPNYDSFGMVMWDKILLARIREAE